MVKQSAFIVAGLAILLSLPFLSGLTSSGDYHGFAIEQAAPEFTLNDLDLQAVTLESLQDKPIYMSFGYTHCTNTCPIQLNALKKLQQKIGQQAHFVWISLDPLGDNQQALVALQQGGLQVLLPDSQHAAKELASAYKNRVIYRQVNGQGELDYIQHNSHIYLINDQQVKLLYQGRSVKSQQLVEDFEKIYQG